MLCEELFNGIAAKQVNIYLYWWEKSVYKQLTNLEVKKFLFSLRFVDIFSKYFALNRWF